MKLIKLHLDKMIRCKGGKFQNGAVKTYVHMINVARKRTQFGNTPNGMGLKDYLPKGKNMRELVGCITRA